MELCSCDKSESFLVLVQVVRISPVRISLGLVLEGLVQVRRISPVRNCVVSFCVNARGEPGSAVVTPLHPLQREAGISIFSGASDRARHLS